MLSDSHPRQRSVQGPHPIILHFVNGSVDEAPLGASAVLRIQQHIIPGPAVACQQPIGLNHKQGVLC